MATKRPFRKPQLETIEIVKREDKTEDLALMWLTKPENYSFKPGQYCTIGYNGIERAYSIASAPHEDLLELFIELVPLDEGGVLTPILWDLTIGNKVTIRPRAKGIFTFKPEKLNHLLVSTVTGVVPYVSFIRDYLNSHTNLDHKFYVLEGASYIDEFVYDKEFHELAEKYPDNIKFIPTISRPNEDRNQNWKGAIGRVNQIVEKNIANFDLSSENTLVYACGHPGMIEDVKSKVSNLGFDFIEERFWKDD